METVAFESGNNIVNGLRHLAAEYLEARKLPELRAFEIAGKLDVRASDLCASAWHLNFLLSISELWSLYEKAESSADWTDEGAGISTTWTDEKESLFARRVFDYLVGYQHFYELSIEEEDYYFDCQSAHHLIVVDRDYEWLFPGILGAIDGYKVLRPINCGPGLRTANRFAERLASKIENIFEVMGAKSKGCDLIADILAVELSDSFEGGDEHVRQNEVRKGHTPPMPQLPGGKNSQRLIRCFWQNANWDAGPPCCDAREICRAIWPEESKTDIESLKGNRLSRAINYLNTQFLSLNIAITFHEAGDDVTMEDYRK